MLKKVSCLCHTLSCLLGVTLKSGASAHTWVRHDHSAVQRSAKNILLKFHTVWHSQHNHSFSSSWQRLNNIYMYMFIENIYSSNPSSIHSQNLLLLLSHLSNGVSIFIWIIDSIQSQSQKQEPLIKGLQVGRFGAI